MIQSHLPKIYWSYFVIHVAHIINIFHTHVLNDFSEMLYKTATHFNQLHVFGFLCYSSTLPTNRKKFLIQGHQNVFLLVLKQEQNDMFC